MNFNKNQDTILFMLLNGIKNKEISSKLQIPKEEVHVKLEKFYDVCGVSNRVQAAILFNRNNH